MFEFKLNLYFGLVGWAFVIIGFLGILKYNKEYTFIFLVSFAIIYGRLVFNLIPNAIFVTIVYIFIFIYILVKLRLIDAKHQLSIKE